MSNNLCEYYFKLAYTSHTTLYKFPPTLTINQFIDSSVNKILVDFEVCIDETIEIVEAGNPDNRNGKDAELAPAIERSNELMVRKFGKNNAFYIRKIKLYNDEENL
jgi:hypothetical protein